MTRRLGPALVAGVVTVAALGGSWVVWGRRASPGPDEQVVTRELNDSLIYHGIVLYQKGDYHGAASAWQRYIEGAPPKADTVSVREMIQEAESAASSANRPTRRGRRTRSSRSSRASQPEVLQPVAPNRSVPATVHRMDPIKQEVGA